MNNFLEENSYFFNNIYPYLNRIDKIKSLIALKKSLRYKKINMKKLEKSEKKSIK